MLKVFCNVLKRRKTKKLLLTKFEWKPIPEEEWEGLATWDNGQVNKHQVEAFLNAKFKKVASQMGIMYNSYVKKIFIKQNKHVFSYVKGYAFKSKDDAIRELKPLALLPVQTEVEEVLEQLRKLSPEQQPEVLQLLANKRIKITVEDI